MNYYYQERERQNVFPPQTDAELGIYSSAVQFGYKQNGRIFVEKAEDVAVVKRLLEELVGEFEWGYYPKDLVAVYDKYALLTYVGKFEPEDLRPLLTKTLELGVRCFIVTSDSSDSDW